MDMPTLIFERDSEYIFNRAHVQTKKKIIQYALLLEGPIKEDLLVSLADQTQQDKSLKSLNSLLNQLEGGKGDQQCHPLISTLKTQLDYFASEEGALEDLISTLEAITQKMPEPSPPRDTH